MFAVIGWLVVVGFGLWLTIGGAFMVWLGHLIGARTEKWPFGMLVGGFAVLFAACRYAPFSITMGLV